MITKYILLILISFSIFGEKPIKFVFAHGLGGNKEQVKYYTGAFKSYKDFKILPDNCITFDFPEVIYPGIMGQLGNNSIDNTKVNFAQEDDIEALKKACEPYIKEYDLVLMGLSRGAATIINYAALYPQSIKALVIESAFDSLDSCIQYRLNKFRVGWIPKFASKLFINRLLYPKYQFNGIKPIEAINRIDKNIPTLFIHSKRDHIIPISSSKKLYKMRLDICDNAHFVQLSNSSHASYMNYASDRILYQNSVNEFYTKYNIQLK